MSRIEQRDKMLKVRKIAELVLMEVGRQGPGRPTYTLTHEQMARALNSTPKHLLRGLWT